MSDLSNQKRVLESYMKLRNEPTLRAIAEETGIQITRVHRILKGSEMKVSEFEIFSKLIRNSNFDNKTFESNEFINLAKACFSKLSLESLQDIQFQMERKLMMQELA